MAIVRGASGQECCCELFPDRPLAKSLDTSGRLGIRRDLSTLPQSTEALLSESCGVYFMLFPESGYRRVVAWPHFCFFSRRSRRCGSCITVPCAQFIALNYTVTPCPDLSKDDCRGGWSDAITGVHMKGAMVKRISRSPSRRRLRGLRSFSYRAVCRVFTVFEHTLRESAMYRHVDVRLVTSIKTGRLSY